MLESSPLLGESYNSDSHVRGALCEEEELVLLTKMVVALLTNLDPLAPLREWEEEPLLGEPLLGWV